MLLILSQEQENTNGCKTSVGASIFRIRVCDLSRSSPVKGLYVYVEGIERMPSSARGHAEACGSLEVQLRKRKNIHMELFDDQKIHFVNMAR